VFAKVVAPSLWSRAIGVDQVTPKTAACKSPPPLFTRPSSCLRCADSGPPPLGLTVGQNAGCVAWNDSAVPPCAYFRTLAPVSSAHGVVHCTGAAGAGVSVGHDEQSFAPVAGPDFGRCENSSRNSAAH